jgi:excinuclease ABC subunit B
MRRAELESMSDKDIAREIKRLEKLMLEHAKDLDFEKAAQVRDQLAVMRQQAFGASGSDNMALLVPQSS